MKMKVPFWRNRKLAGKPLSKLPSHLRTLLKTSKLRHTGAGPRTLDSVISYIPTLKSQNNKLDDIRYQLFPNNRHIPDIVTDNPAINVIICISQRDFPISIHHRLLVLLTMKGIDLNNVHWVITDVDQLGEYPVFPINLGPVNKTNMKLWKTQYLEELNTYLQYFTLNKLAENVERAADNSDLFQTSSKDITASVYDKLKGYRVSSKHLHLFSVDLPWTLTPILHSLDYDPFQSANTYIIGQTNSGKTSLLRNMIKAFHRDLNRETSTVTDTVESELTNSQELMADPQLIKIFPGPFSSKFNVYNVPGMRLIDTPGYVRTEGSIWSHVSERGIHLLRMPDSDTLQKMQKNLILCPRILGYDKHKANVISGFHIGGLVFVKPWLVIPKDNSKLDCLPHIKINVMKNMPGEAKAISAQEMNERMYDIEHSKVIKEREWSRYFLTGERIELVLDNIGSFTATAGDLPFAPRTQIFWEVSIPERVRFLSRSWDSSGKVILESVEPLKMRFCKELTKLMHQSREKQIYRQPL